MNKNSIIKTSLFTKEDMHMEKNKKEENEERVKIYDKDMYISQEKLKTIVIIIIIFIIGFIAGYFANNFINTEETNNYNNGTNIEEQNN